MKRVALLFTIVLVGCSSAPADPVIDHAAHDPHAGHEMPATDAFAIEDRSADDDIAFAITKNGAPFPDYGISHTKRMHLIVVRDDLTHFAHLHPEQDADGIWRTDFTPETGGTYWMYADFVDAAKNPHTLRFTNIAPGETGPVGYAKLPGVVYDGSEEEAGTEKILNRYRVSLSTSEMIENGLSDLELSFRVEDNGEKAVLEDYLGAKGHVVLLSTTGEFFHVHPTDGAFGDSKDWSAHFTVPGMKPGLYRIFAQFQIDGQIIIAPFHWDR